MGSVRMPDRKVIYGITSFIFMISFYIVLNTLLSGFEYALYQFKLYWSYILAIASGFGVQMFLLGYARNFNVSCRSVTASGGISAGSMVVCCLHHLTDFLPILGGVGGLLLLSYYIEPFLVLGALSSWTGVIFMLATIQKNRLYEGRVPEIVFGLLNFWKMRYASLILSVLVSLYYFVTYNPFTF
jgi:Cu+-exporting ATPase